MAKITVNIEAETAEDLKEVLKGLIANEALSGTSLHVPVEEQSATPKIKQKPKTKAKPTGKEAPEKKEEDSTDSISETTESTADSEVEVSGESETSTSVSEFPNATKEDVIAAVKKALANKKRDAVGTALQRQGVGKVPELKEASYGVFLTDLKALAGE